MRRLSSGAATLLAIPLAVVAASSAASAGTSAARPFTTVVAAVPHFSGRTTVYMEIFANPLPMTKKTGAPLLAGPVQVQGLTGTLAIPASRETAALAKVNGGTANLIVQFTNGRQVSRVFVPAHASGATTLTRSGAVESSQSASPVTRVMFRSAPRTLSRHDQRAFAQLGPARVCSFGHSTFSNNKTTRIGELHVAATSSMKGTYNYTTRADSSMSVGAKGMGSGWAADGTVSINNSIGSGGTVTHRGGWVRYVDDHMDYEHQFWSCGEFIEPYASAGDTFDGTNSPRSNPWGNCGNAPFEGTVNKNNGTWHGLTDSAVTESWSFSAFGLYDGHGSTGYETTNGIEYANSGSSNTFVCGAGGHGHGLVGSPVIYNSLS